MTTTQDTNCVAIKGTDRQGRTVWYTGRAGKGFISSERSEAFVGFYPTGAALRATSLNRGTVFHGVHFQADV